MLSPGQRRTLAAGCGRVSFEVSMARYCSLKAGGRAWALAEVADLAELRALLAFCAGEKIPWRILGRGSNILVRDQGFPGVLIRLTGTFCSINRAEQGEAEVVAGGGALLAELLAWCRQQGLGGLEYMVAIPGSVGGAALMNAGAFGRSIGDCVASLTLLDSRGVLEERAAEACHFSYRSFSLDGVAMEELVILGLRLRLEPCPPEQITGRMRAYQARRKASQPGGRPSAGSFFKNPPGAYAGQLIEQAGLKGMRVGDALVSPRHANFIVNDGQATASDILELMAVIQKKVAQQTGILLEPEVHIF